MPNVTRILSQIESGDRWAAEKTLPLASLFLSKWRPPGVAIVTGKDGHRHERRT